ncbi:MAG: hypothetical protein ACOCZ8_00935, partial [Bacteroidota bacterium]
LGFIDFERESLTPEQWVFKAIPYAGIPAADAPELIGLDCEVDPEANFVWAYEWDTIPSNPFRDVDYFSWIHSTPNTANKRLTAAVNSGDCQEIGCQFPLVYSTNITQPTNSPYGSWFSGPPIIMTNPTDTDPPNVYDQLFFAMYDHLPNYVPPGSPWNYTLSGADIEKYANLIGILISNEMYPGYTFLNGIYGYASPLCATCNGPYNHTFELHMGICRDIPEGWPE